MKRQERKQFSKQQNRQNVSKTKRLGVFYVIRITCFNEW